MLAERARKHDEATRRAAEEELARIDVRLQSVPAGRVANDSARAYDYRRLVEDKARLLRLVATL